MKPWAAFLTTELRHRRRHRRYFIAVAEERSLTSAAERLHTAQLSVSREIRDLELEKRGTASAG